MDIMHLIQIAILALIQGAAELLPVSSSAHVIMAQKLMGLDPGAPEMTFLLVMLHTGTMFAVLFYFWPRWKSKLLIRDPKGKLLPFTQNAFLRNIALATAITGFLGLTLKALIERVILERVLGYPVGEIEHLFRNLPMIAASLFTVGTIIFISGRKIARNPNHASLTTLTQRHSALIGAIQGLCLPFRGFSRSGATISASLWMGINRELAEDFSFALAVAVTPPVIMLQVKRLVIHQANLVASGAETLSLGGMVAPGLVGMVFAFASGLVALRFLSAWLERGRWHYFGVYCWFAGVAVLVVNRVTQ